MNIEYIASSTRISEIFYKGLQNICTIKKVKTPSNKCQMLIVPIEGEASVSFLEQTIFPKKCFVVFLVLEFSGKIAPFIKLADYTLYAGPRQKDIVQGLLELEYPCESIAFPGESPEVTSGANDVTIYISTPFTEESSAYFTEVLQLVYSWYGLANRETCHILYHLDTKNESLFRIFTEDLSRTDEGQKYNFHSVEKCSVDEIKGYIAIAEFGDCFGQELCNEQVDELIAKKDPGLLYIPFKSNWIMEEFARRDFKYANDYNGVSRSVLTDEHKSISFTDFAARLEHLYNNVRPELLQHEEARFATTEVDTLDTLNVLHGKPLSNRFIFSICFRNQEDKIGRAIDSILAQGSEFDYGIAIVDDGSEDTSSEIVLEKLADTGVDFILVKNKKRRYAARNFYNVSHLLTTGAENSILIELDGDDYLSGTNVLQRLTEEYDKGILKTSGTFSIYPEVTDDDHVALTLLDMQKHTDFAKPWSIVACNSWLPLRSCKLDLLLQVEIDYYLERESKEWLKDRHDAITQSRIIELAGTENCSFITDELYVYDLSGVDHDHGSSDEYDYAANHMKLFRDLNKYYRAYSF